MDLGSSGNNGGSRKEDVILRAGVGPAPGAVVSAFARACQYGGDGDDARTVTYPGLLALKVEGSPG